jgi:pimeloyl-ACP methyl ester carboxylesterase
MRFPNRVWMLGARRLPILVGLMRRMVYPMIMGDPQEAGRRLAASFPPVDRQYIETPRDRERFVLDLQEGYRQGWQGPAQDDIITNSPWGFRLEDITVRIDVWQGEVDANVPLNQGQYQHGRLPNSRLTVLPGQAHLYLLAQWRAVLAALVE